MDVIFLLYYEFGRNTSPVCNTNVMETRPETYDFIVFPVKSPNGDI
jgi:hypothetical protein